MNYADAAERLFDRRRFRPDPGTDSTEALLEHLGDPHTTYDSIQIAGSNGKGSTARFLAEILGAAGYTVGLYTSPHLDTIRERIQVDGRPISKRRITTFVDTVDDYLVETGGTSASPTFFETVTGLALWQFAQESVDFAVLEAGMGGQYDATSAVDPVASAVTTVTLEHTDVLGDTVSAIARDKAAVASTDNPLVTATTDTAYETIESTVQHVHRVGADDPADTTVGAHDEHDLRGTTVELTGSDWAVDTELGVIGGFQAGNAGVAAVLARQVTIADTSTIATGLRQTTIPGRMELVDTDPVVILDGAHNPGACTTVADTIPNFDHQDLHLVFGAMHDKDLDGMVASLPTPETVYTTAAPIDRAADPRVLARRFEEHGIETTTEPAVEDALTAACQTARPEDIVLVCGSLAVVAAARRHWTRTPIPRHVDGPKDPRTLLATTDVPTTTDRIDSETFEYNVVSLEAPSRHASAITEAATAVDLTATRSPLTDIDHELVPILIAGPTPTLTDFIDSLATRDDGLSHYADALDSSLDTHHQPQYGDGDRPAIMGILNVTPDSFHDGGQYSSVDAALDHAKSLVDAGADIIDIGGESTRPGADPVPIETERDRVLPVVDAVTDLDITVSVDTRRGAVARPALEAGADIINDVSAGTDPTLLYSVADHDATVVLMHSIATPVDPSRTPTYDDVVTDVIDDLVEPVQRARRSGLDDNQIIVDPGLGFGKSPADSFTLLDRLDELHALGCPVMVGHSYKSMFEAAGFPEPDRTIPTVAATALATDRGADIIRVHDVEPNVDAVTTATTVADRPDPE